MTTALPDNGFLKGAAEDFYRQLPHMNVSLLKHGLKSMAHMKHAREHPDDATKKMNLGSLLHAMVLEPHTVKDRFAFAPTVDGRTKEGKAAKAEFEKTAAGKIIVSEQDKIDASNMAAAILTWCIDPANIEPASLITAPGSDAVTEAAMVWRETEWAQDHPCKGRLDRVCPTGTEYIDGPVILDIKTTTDASPAGFERAVANFRYDIQAAWYMRGYQVIAGRKPRFIFLFVESEAPHNVAAYELNPESIEVGAHDARRLLGYVERATASGDWPGYPHGINVGSLPTWKLIRHNEGAANEPGWGDA